MQRIKCKHCENLLVESFGPSKSKILLFGSYPDYEEVRNGYLMSGSSRDMLQTELSKVGLQLSTLRYITLWKHSKNDECKMDWHINHSMSEIKGKTHVLVMGSDASRELFGKNAGDLSGLKLTHKLFKGVTFIVSPGPAEIFNSGVGELRLALSRFSDTIKK